MNFNWKEICSVSVENGLSLDNFWSGVNVWIERSHIINRKLTAVELCDVYRINCKNNTCNHDVIANHVIRLLQDDKCISVKELIMSLQMEFNVQLENKKVEDNGVENLKDCNMVLQCRNLLPKNLNKFKDVFEVLLIDKLKGSVIFCPSKEDVLHSRITPAFPYKIKHHDARIKLEVWSVANENDLVEELSVTWLKTHVFPKIARWCQNLPSSTILPSLKLVCAKKYNQTYNLLKTKYGKELVKIWPECTDPLKYVYEDIAIAAYLLTLWEKERKDLHLEVKQTFVDLGCGNGLLVHILSAEGFNGIGIDLRKRNIWDLYGKETILIEKTFEPSDQLLFPEYDWIIGNHSDELTPWIPVIAARSSYNMRVFLLPCCCYTFNGKYERSHSGNTQYQSYLLFLKDLCETMGLTVQQDKLRIPSTKRVCFVCPSRTYTKQDEESAELQRVEFINLHSKKTSKVGASTSEDISNNSRCLDFVDEKQSSNFEHSLNECNEHDNWIKDFKPRLIKDSIKNCTALDETFLRETVNIIANILLLSENFIQLETTRGSIKWNTGGKLSIGELVRRIDQTTLHSLKNQCGGFQTLLRNHKNVFKIENGLVSMRVPSTDTHSSVTLNIKPKKSRTKRRKKSSKHTFSEKKCYFFFYHPQGCPLSAEECNFSHSTV